MKEKSDVGNESADVSAKKKVFFFSKNWKKRILQRRMSVEKTALPENDQKPFFLQKIIFWKSKFSETFLRLL